MNLVTPLYAATLSMLFVVLSVRTLRLRRRFHVGIGQDNEPLLARAVRAHGNFAEYVPLALLLLYFVELGNAPTLFLHGLGVTLLLGRSLHAWGVSQVDENYAFRVAGMAMTFASIISSALLILLNRP